MLTIPIKNLGDPLTHTEFNSVVAEINNKTTIIKVADYASLPTSGTTNVIYITEDDGAQFYWNGSVYKPTGGNTGGGGGSFSDITGTTYTGGNKYKTITGSSVTTITVDATSGGVLLIYNSGAATSITFEDTSGATKSFTINASGTNGGLTGFGIVIANGKYNITPDVNMKYLTIPAPDTTAPTTGAVEATDANTIDVPISEAYTGTLGYSFTANSAALTVTARTAVGGNILRHTISETMLDTDTLAWAYTPGNIADTATTPNAMIADSGSVTNSVPASGGGLSYITFINQQTAGITEAPAHSFASAGIAFMVSDQSMAANGSYQVQIGGGTTGFFLFGVDTDDNLETYYNLPPYTGVYPFYLVVDGGTYQIGTGTSGYADTTVAAALLDVVGFTRTGTSLQFRKSSDGGTTWTNLGSAKTLSGTLWVKPNWPSGYAEHINPQGAGWS